MDRKANRLAHWIANCEKLCQFRSVTLFTLSRQYIFQQSMYTIETINCYIGYQSFTSIRFKHHSTFKVFSNPVNGWMVFPQRNIPWSARWWKSLIKHTEFVNNTDIELYIISLLTFHMLCEGIKLFILLVFNVINCPDDISSQSVIQLEYIFLAFVLVLTHVIRVQ